jgi:hypothetical protein
MKGLSARVRHLEEQYHEPAASEIREAQHRARMGEPVDDLDPAAVEMAHRIRAAVLAAVAIASAEGETDQ